MNCANCSTPLTGHYCSNCGQPAKSRRGPIWRVIGEFTEDVFSPDSKFIQSIMTLLFKPGVLTKKFLEGKRYSVLPPVRMFLVISVLFFLVFEIPYFSVENKNVYIGSTLLGKEEPTKGQSNLVLFSSGSSNDWFTQQFNKLMEDKRSQMLALDPQVAVDRIMNSIENTLPNAMIFFLPFFALMMKFLYFFRRVLYFDHLIFALHIQSWLMLATMAIYGLALIDLKWLWLCAIIPIYLAKAQKVTYEQSYWLVIPKTFAILFVYTMLVSFVGLVAMLVSILMFGD